LDIRFVFDRNGNITTIGIGYSIMGTTYNWRNLPLCLPSIAQPSQPLRRSRPLATEGITKSSTTYSYKYDHNGSRTFKNSGATRYVRGAFGEVLAVYNSSTLLHHNIVRPDGTVIGRREGSNRLYYHRDHLGSTRAVANASGSVVETQDYYPFGLQMPGRSMTTGNSAKEKFTSHELDDEVDLYYMVARRYAPEFGRFMSVDPLADEFPGWTPYHYVNNNPILFIDPTGLSAECPDPPCGFERFLNFLIANTDPETGEGNFSEREFAEVFFRAAKDEAGQVAEDAARSTLSGVKDVSDIGSDVSSATAAVSALITLGSGGATSALTVPITAAALEAGLLFDGVGTAASLAEVVIFNEDRSEFDSRLTGLFFNFTAGKILDQKAESFLRFLSTSTQATRVVAPSLRLQKTTHAAADATKVILPKIILD